MAAAPITGKSIAIKSAGMAIALLTVSPFTAVRMRLVVEVLRPLLLRDRNAFGSRAEPPQQRIDSDCDDAENRDLAERVECAEVHQDDVDDVGAAALRISVLDKETRDALRLRAAS